MEYDTDHEPLDVVKATPHETVPLKEESDIENDWLETKRAIIVAAVLSILLILLAYLDTGTEFATVAECYFPISHPYRYTVPGSDNSCESIADTEIECITVTVTVTVTETPTPILTKHGIPPSVTEIR
ncbi:hypothetical protein M436DRAFT_64462 [Aureobasidium namibiae CBS 147.97]|uniref:Uncharacterized protein n=1 Tax=Aureobasidium namibiae CBS 147.97 TaxID=1043004 RepID=A0A074WHE4_9PEZI